MVAGGLILSAAAILADVVRHGDSRMGALQWAMLLTGFLCLVAGLALASGRGRTWLDRRVAYASTTRAAASAIVLAALFGLISGWGQVAVQFVRRNFRHEIIGMGVDYPWMIPLASLAAFLLLGLLLQLAQNRWPRRITQPIVIGILSFAAFFSLLLLVRHIHKVALAVLAAGLAVQLSRMVARSPGAVNSGARLAVGWPALFRYPPPNDAPTPYPTRREFIAGAGVAISVTALAITGRETAIERRAIALIPSTRRRAPDVLLVVLDTVRASSLSLHGYTKPTSPQLERLAEQAVTFGRAIAPSPWTLPSHASMFTGRWPHDLSTGPWSPLDATYPTLAEYLRDRGYLTAGFVANREYCGREFGLSRGFVHYEDYRITPGQAALYTTYGRTAMQESELIQSLRSYRNFGRKSAERLTDDFLSWHQANGADRPIFAFLNYWDAHDPYTPPGEYARRFAPPDTRGGAPPVEPPDPKTLAALQGHYDASIAYADEQVGVLVSELERRGALEDTLLIVLSDHGEHFGEHGLMLHGGSLYAQELHVPFLLSHPTLAPQGLHLPGAVSLRNLAATVVDLVGLRADAAFPGQSLRLTWDGGTPTDPVASEADRVDHLSDQYPASRGRLASLVSNNLHYIWREYDGGEELYDLSIDPAETNNLVGTIPAEELAELRNGLRAALSS
jgi:arylsulfatase A-like enzyme